MGPVSLFLLSSSSFQQPVCGLLITSLPSVCYLKAAKEIFTFLAQMKSLHGVQSKDFNCIPGLTKVGGACDHVTASHAPPATKAARISEPRALIERGANIRSSATRHSSHPISPPKLNRMGRNKLTLHEKARALTQLELGMQAIYNLKHAAAPLPPGAIPKRKVGSGAVRKTSIRTDNILKREVMSDPAVTASTLKKKHPDLLKHVAIRTVQHRLQKDLSLPTQRAAKKPLLTKAMKKKRINFCKKYQHWTSDDWKKVMFSDESTFRLVRGASKIVRRPKNVSWCSPKYTVKTVKHPDSVMVWGTFSGCEGRGGLYGLPKNVTMKGTNYIEVLRDHMLPFWPIHQCHHFMHDGAPAH
ncbi:Transposable element Tcb2 transposase-like 4, partial [Homarus americanus]